MEKITTIIIEGHMATGKTRLGSLLTFNGRAGIVIEGDELRGSSGHILYTDAWLRRIEFCPRVVITTTSTCAEIMQHPRLQNLIAARASLDHNLELIKVDRGSWPEMITAPRPAPMVTRLDLTKLKRFLKGPYTIPPGPVGHHRLREIARAQTQTKTTKKKKTKHES